MILVARFKQIVDGLIAYVQHDFDKNPEKETLLYHMFYGIKDGSFDFYEQAKSLFLRTNNSPRKISTRLEYPKDKSHLPCIIIREPSRAQGLIDPLGGYGLPQYMGGMNSEREAFVRSNISNVEIMCFSENMLESVLIHEVMYCLFNGAHDTLDNEFLKFNFNSTEIIAENALFPNPILIKTLTVNVDAEDKLCSIIQQKLIYKYIFEGVFIVGADYPYDKIK